MCVPSVDAGKSPPIPYVYVNSSGSVKNYRPMQVVLACSLEMYAFPFDKQNCSLTFRSWLHSGLFPACEVVVGTCASSVMPVVHMRNHLTLKPPKPYGSLTKHSSLKVTLIDFKFLHHRMEFAQFYNH